MSVIDELVANNAAATADFAGGDLPPPPSMPVVVVLHTDCGMMRFTDDQLRATVEIETGVRPPFAFASFSNLEAEVRQSLQRLRRSPFLLHRDAVRGFVYEVTDGRSSRSRLTGTSTGRRRGIRGGPTRSPR